MDTNCRGCYAGRSSHFAQQYTAGSTVDNVWAVAVSGRAVMMQLREQIHRLRAETVESKVKRDNDSAGCCRYTQDEDTAQGRTVVQDNLK
jgi:hypothetical protein